MACRSKDCPFLWYSLSECLSVWQVLSYKSRAGPSRGVVVRWWGGGGQQVDKVYRWLSGERQPHSPYVASLIIAPRLRCYSAQTPITLSLLLSSVLLYTLSTSTYAVPFILLCSYCLINGWARVGWFHFSQLSFKAVIPYILAFIACYLYNRPDFLRLFLKLSKNK